MSESKQDVVVRMVTSGEFTREQIKSEADCTSGALASYLSGMRNAAKYSPGIEMCPVTDDNGVMSAITFEAAEALKAEKTTTTKAPAKTPAERFEAADKRVIRTGNILAKAQERFDNAPDNRELELRLKKAEIELELAEIELSRAATLNEDAPEEAGDVEAEEELI